MNKMKRLASMLLAIALLLTCAPFAPLALLTAEAATITKSGTCGYNLTWTLDDEGTLTISGTGEMKDWEIDSASSWGMKLKKVVIMNGVTSIGDWAFSGQSKLTSVIIPDSVITIGGNAFRDCTGLTSMTIPNSVTTIGDHAFKYCYNLSSVTIPNSVTTIGSDAFERTAWYNAQSNGLVYVGKVVYKYKGTCPSQVTIKEGTLGIAGIAFRDCTGLTSMTIPNSVTSIGDAAFDGCYNLTSMTIPNSVTTIGYNAFYDTGWYNAQPDGLVYAGKVAYKYKGTCPSEVTIKDGTLGIADSAFSGCNGLTSVDIPNSVTNIGSDAFRGCAGLTSMTIPNSVTSIGDAAFYHCFDLTSVTIPNSVTTIGKEAFYRCTGLEKIYFDGTAPIIGNFAFDDVIARAYYYPDSTWTEGVRHDYGGHITWVALECLHSYTSVVTPPTCTEQGYTTHTCSRCGDSYKDTYIKENGHSYSKWEKVDDTYHKHTCTVCKTATESKTHDWDSGTITKQPTCKETGIKTYCCPTCGAKKTETLAKTSNHNYTSVVTPPTCTEQGYKTHTCTICGNSYKDSYTSKKDHTYGAWVRVDDTNHKRTCTVCQTATETKNHDWDAGTVTKQPTCKETGIKTYSCPTCSTTKTETLAKTSDHNYTSVVTPPTCTEQGYTTHTCSVCGNSYKDTYVDASGHSYGKWETVDDTNHKHTCTVCKTATESKTHDWDNGTVTKEPTCKETGTKVYRCPTCGATKTETLPVTNDHEYGGWEKVDDTKHRRTCAICKTATETVSHSWDSGSVTKPTSCTEGTLKIYTCTECKATSWVIIPGPGHKYGNWEQVDETNHKRTCTVCKTHSETKAHTFGEDHICTGCGYKAYTVGDFDGDGLVTDADVIYLLWYTVFPEDYPLNQGGDFTGDGQVTDADVIYLLWHTVFPEDYPLN